MGWKNIVYFKEETETLDSKRRPKKSYVDKPIFCNKKEIGITEFYQAQSQGIKPSIKIEVKEIDWKDIYTHMKFENKVYSIIRTAPAKNECIVIVGEALVINNE